MLARLAEARNGMNIMKARLIFLLAMGLVAVLRAEDKPASDPAQIRKEMARVRRSTNWDDPVERELANLKIQELADKLLKAQKQPSDTDPNTAASPSAEDEDPRMKILKSGLDSANASDGANILLATNIRNDVVEAYRDDESPTVKNPQYAQELDVLVINLSLPSAPVLIRQMDQFKSIRTLIVTCNSAGAPVNLAEIMGKARGYPLERLYITNFGKNVATIPDLSRFRELKVLALYGNDLHSVPPSVGALPHLQSLYLDINPVASVVGAVRTLPGLAELGISKTAVSPEEREQIHQLLPHCKLL
jgi:hypothetical protein